MISFAHTHCAPLHSLQPNSQSSGTRTATNLNTAYTHKGAGSSAIAYRYTSFYASAIDELYIFLDSNGGTLANITMECTIYNETAGSATIPSTTVRATSTACAMPSAVDKWIKFTFGTPYTPTVGEVLWFVCYNMAASPTVDFPGITITNQIAMASSVHCAPDNRRVFNTLATTDGFSTGASSTSSSFVFKHANGEVAGQPGTAINTTYYTSNTRKRGIKIQPLTAPLTVSGIYFSATSSVNGIQLFSGSNGPNTTPDYSWSTGTDVNEVTDEQIGYKIIDTPITLQANTTYRLVNTFSGNVQTPRVLQIEDYASYSSIFDAFFDSPVINGSTIDDGAGGWTDDNAVAPNIGFLLSAQVSGGSGSGLKVNSGMNGGLNG